MGDVVCLLISWVCFQFTPANAALTEESHLSSKMLFVIEHLHNILFCLFKSWEEMQSLSAFEGETGPNELHLVCLDHCGCCSFLSCSSFLWPISGKRTGYGLFCLPSQILGRWLSNSIMQEASESVVRRMSEGRSRSLAICGYTFSFGLKGGRTAYLYGRRNRYLISRYGFYNKH